MQHGSPTPALVIHPAGICHTDYHQVNDEWGGGIFPMVPGHEIVGIVTEVGPKVKSLKPGDRVGVGCFVESCMKCDRYSSLPLVAHTSAWHHARALLAAPPCAWPADGTVLLCSNPSQVQLSGEAVSAVAADAALLRCLLYLAVR